MVNIAVCDDDTQFAAELENRILSYGKQKAVSLDTEVFSDGDSILQAILNGGQYDLVYMDIEMGNRNGISTVREIKKISPRFLFPIYFQNNINQSKAFHLYLESTKPSLSPLFPYLLTAFLRETFQ